MSMFQGSGMPPFLEDFTRRLLQGAFDRTQQPLPGGIPKQQIVGMQPLQTGSIAEMAKSFGLDPKKEMYKMPAIFVGEYAEADARLTYKLHEKLKWEIAKDNLTTIYDIECQLIKVIYNMTKRGVRVDIERAHNLTEKFSKKD